MGSPKRLPANTRSRAEPKSPPQFPELEGWKFKYFYEWTWRAEITRFSLDLVTVFKGPEKKQTPKSQAGWITSGVARHPFRIFNLFAASLVSTRQLSAGDPGEVRSRRLHRTCTA